LAVVVPLTRTQDSVVVFLSKPGPEDEGVLQLASSLVVECVRKMFGDGRIVQRDETFMVVRVGGFEKVQGREGGTNSSVALSWTVHSHRDAMSERGVTVSGSEGSAH